MNTLKKAYGTAKRSLHSDKFASAFPLAMNPSPGLRPPSPHPTCPAEAPARRRMGRGQGEGRVCQFRRPRRESIRWILSLSDGERAGLPAASSVEAGVRGCLTRTRFSFLIPLLSSFFISGGCLQLLAESSPQAPTNSPPPQIPDLRPPRAEIPPTVWEQRGGLLIATTIVVALIVLLVVLFILRRRPPAVIPPEIQARRDLAPLVKEPETGARLSRVSQILRRYLTHAFSLPAEELTTTEFCAMIGGHASFGAELSNLLCDFLRRCDERKFSPATISEPLGAASQALNLVQQCENRRAQLRQEQRALEATKS